MNSLWGDLTDTSTTTKSLAQIPPSIAFEKSSELWVTHHSDSVVYAMYRPDFVSSCDRMDGFWVRCCSVYWDIHTIQFFATMGFMPYYQQSFSMNLVPVIGADSEILKELACLTSCAVLCQHRILTCQQRNLVSTLEPIDSGHSVWVIHRFRKAMILHTRAGVQFTITTYLLHLVCECTWESIGSLTAGIVWM